MTFRPSVKVSWSELRENFITDFKDLKYDHYTLLLF